MLPNLVLPYHCGTPDCPSVTFGAAFEVGFVCSNCSNPLVQQDNEDSIRFLSQKTKSLQENLNEGL